MSTPALDDTTLDATPKPRRKSTRPKASDYPGNEGKLVFAASHRYYIQIWAYNPFPDEELETSWAVDAWESVAGDNPAPPLPDQTRYVGQHFPLVQPHANFHGV
jgi:hypothetical protein